MKTLELESKALKLSPEARAHLAERLLESLEDLSEEENTRLWAMEAQRRDAESVRGRPAKDVLRDARKRLR
ncbi:MAG: addiction module protein [Planctomycetota bacterium]